MEEWKCSSPPLSPPICEIRRPKFKLSLQQDTIVQAVNETRRYILFYVSLTLSPTPRHRPLLLLLLLLLLFLFLFLSLSLFLSLFRFLLREHISILRLIYLVNKFCILLFSFRTSNSLTA